MNFTYKKSTDIDVHYLMAFRKYSVIAQICSISTANLPSNSVSRFCQISSSSLSTLLDIINSM